ncbi:NAD(P)H-dependent flavin oxidoreductase [Aquibaculum arenosum]|uniref:Nitronate monooxygenase n=1 Tax=Aquibaculum arenosum TaxID=3032591 RepID=A0ABT5YNU4_9PROT|nr:nitronate monooxygenase [Fodinicurvata sp. CAU 1616]MDF2096634.1 nitronate monooxygenase [Fodinicurvata sp. CAU 1616]
MQTPLTDLLAIDHPLLLAPMGTVAGGKLCAAVSDAGGLGLLGGGYGDAQWLERELDLLEGKRFGVGFITWSLARQPELLDLALEHRPEAVMFSFGEASAFVAKAAASGAKTICQVQSLAAARQARDWGADIIVAQGTEAGGHGGARSTFTLVPAVVDAVAPLPVVAAGGVADGRGLAAALMLGATGVLIGTRFFASDEALAAHGVKQRLLSAAGDETQRTRVFDLVRGYPWPDHFTGRAVANDFLQRWHGREAALSADLEAEQARYFEATARGDADTAVVFGGECLDLIAEQKPAAQIVAEIMQEAQARLSRF